MQRDSQRSKLYAFEKIHIWPSCGFRAALTFKECEELIRCACVLAKVRTPQLKDGRGCRFARGGTREVTLPVWARFNEVVVHEVAHTISLIWTSSNIAGHGPEFVRVYLWLVNQLLHHEDDESYLVEKAEAYGLKVASKEWLNNMLKTRSATVS